MVPHLPYPRRSHIAPPLPAAAAAGADTPAPDLQTQLEALLDSVWHAEADWRFNDRLDMALRSRRSTFVEQ